MLTVLVVQEVTTTLVGYERKNVPHNHPPGSSVTYGGYIYSMLLLSECGMRATKIFKTIWSSIITGFSFYMGWTVFFVYLLNGCIFLVLSRKRKDEKLEGSIEDGMRIIGR